MSNYEMCRKGYVMAIVKYGEWEFDVDVEKTRDYYRGIVIDESSQVNRNFKRYCENLSEEEKVFFDSFGILPDKVDCEVIDIEKKKISFSGQYYVYAKVIKGPKDIFEIMEEYDESDDESDIEMEDNSVYLGGFEFSFYKATEEDYDLESIPRGCITIDFLCDDMEWLLEEKCEYKSLFPKFWEIGRKRELLKERKKELQEYIDNQENIFEKNLIKYKRLSKRQVNQNKKKWIKVFTPKQVKLSNVKRLCYGESTYLWHLFSFEFVEALENNDAIEKFNSVNKDKAIFFDNLENVAYELNNLGNMTAEFLEESWDCTIVDSDFTWTYSKTHEYDFGPFYYEKS